MKRVLLLLKPTTGKHANQTAHDIIDIATEPAKTNWQTAP